MKVNSNKQLQCNLPKEMMSKIVLVVMKRNGSVILSLRTDSKELIRQGCHGVCAEHLSKHLKYLLSDFCV